MGLRAFFLAGATILALPASAAELKVFAAASLTDALGKVLAVCEVSTGIPATGIYAGSGTIARQIDQGAPATLYISANPQWMDWLQKRGRIAEDTRSDLLGNTLVLIEPTEAESGLIADDETLTSLTSLADQRIAIGEPTSVPVGIYARQALQTRGWWDGLNKLVQTSSVREVMTWVIRGEVNLGAVYKTDAKADPRVSIVHEFTPDDHDPIRYPAAVIADFDSIKARRLLTCLKGEEATEIFKEYGFVIPKG